MRAISLNVSPFEFIEILDAKIVKNINLHGSAWIKGIIDEDAEDQYVGMSLSEIPVALTALDFNGAQRVLFHGILEDLRIGVENGLKIMELTIMSYSRLLDQSPGIRVFQNVNTTYNALVDATLAPFNNASYIINTGDEQSIGEMFVRYQETAWEFLVRMASTKNDVIVPNNTFEGIHIYFGFPDNDTSDIPPLSPISYEIKKDVGGYIYKRDNDLLSLSENDTIYFIVKDREVREIGEQVIFRQRPLCITAVQSGYEGQELVHTYTLTSRNQTKIPKARNFNIIGASLDGTVSKVAGSKVKMSLATADSNDPQVTKWHAFSTVYSSPDGTGWYAMPVIGDKLRLYFPTEIDDDGYAISAVHLNVKKSVQSVATIEDDENESDEGEAPRTNKDNKLISNDFGKEIELTPTSIRISSGGKTILIDDNSGISIISDTDIEFRGDNEVTLSSLKGSIVMVAGETVTISQEQATIEMNNENIVFKGAQDKVE